MPPARSTQWAAPPAFAPVVPIGPRLHPALRAMPPREQPSHQSILPPRRRAVGSETLVRALDRRSVQPADAEPGRRLSRYESSGQVCVYGPRTQRSPHRRRDPSPVAHPKRRAAPGTAARFAGCFRNTTRRHARRCRQSPPRMRSRSPPRTGSAPLRCILQEISPAATATAAAEESPQQGSSPQRSASCRRLHWISHRRSDRLPPHVRPTSHRSRSGISRHPRSGCSP